MVDILIFTDALITSSILTLLTLGLTLTYLTTKVPNFAHGTFASVGIYVGLTVSKIFHQSIYYGMLPGFILGGLVAVIQYIAFLRPMTKRNASTTTLMVATIAFDIFLIAILNIIADYIQIGFHVESRYFILSNLDFFVFGTRGIILVAPILVIAVVVSLFLLLNKTKFGIAMRATIENPLLAGTVGINTDLVYIVSWFIAGGLAGMVGSITTLWYIGNTNVGSDIFLISIFAASVTGGIYNVYGAVVGGFVIGVTQSVIIRQLAGIVGAWIIPYQPLIPLIAMVVTLLISPSGIMGVDLKAIRKRLAREADAR
ncbi:MAG: branched-chain amino acid transport system permease protein [Thermoproteota archaeon]|nr:branched-chain amino acid transport system permease protein [Thermoproteota archaeon]